jgi:hypothetical protein
MQDSVMKLAVPQVSKFQGFKVSNRIAADLQL